MLCHCIPCHAMPHTIQHTIPYYRIPNSTYQMPDTSYHILIPYPYPHVMPYYVLSYRIKPYIDILSRNTHNRYINTYIQIIGILAQANVDERCGSLRHSWLVCHTPYLKMFLQHSYQYLWRVMNGSCPKYCTSEHLKKTEQIYCKSTQRQRLFKTLVSR